MFRFVADIHLSDIGSLYWEKLQRRTACCIMRMSINGASTIFNFTSYVLYVPIGCTHPFIKNCQPLLANTTAIWSLSHTENEHQRSINSFICCIFANQGIAQIFAFITELLTTLTGKNPNFQR